MVTTSTDPSAATDAVRSPSVLVVLVVHDGASWLHECLASLMAQTHPRLGVVGVDNASTDDSRALLTQALGEGRVIALSENLGVAGAMKAAVELPAAERADYLLVLHDDAALGPDAVARLVEAATGIRGVERVGVVGPKVVDWEDPRVLREVGRSTDAFGHPFTPLQDGEIDQGQYDRVLEVLFVSSCAMLIAREAWQRIGLFDERFAGHHDDLDFCWRARLAGFRVLMTPLAQARHRDAAGKGERGEDRPRSTRYYAERAALASMLKDYGVLTLLWLLPVYAVLGVARITFLLVARRFEDAFDQLAAWGWNVAHLPGTIRRRLRAQSVRRVRDRSVRRFMAATLRVPRWFERAEALLEEQLEEGSEDAPRFRERAATIAGAHPVVVTSVVAIAIGALAYRTIVGPQALTGGALAGFPSSAGAFFHELAASTRSTILGGAQPASPALAGLGALSWVSFGSPALAQKLLLCALPPIAAISMYRSLVRQTAQPAAAILGALGYVMSAVMLWSFSEGRIALLVALATLPAVWDRMDAAFSKAGPSVSMPNFVVGLGVAIAIGLAFEPGVLLGIGVVAAAQLLGGRRRGRGLTLAIGGVVAAEALVFPLIEDLLRAPAAGLSSSVGRTDVWSILRLAPGGGPGTWAIAAFLPIAAALSFAVVGREHRLRAWRALLVVLAGLGLAWASANRYLPEAFTNTTIYVVVAALGEAAIIAYGVGSLATGVTHERFGFRQVAAGVLAIVMSVGLGAQALELTLAEWEVGPNGLPPAWPVIDASGPGDFKILWLGRVNGERFPAPGGDPQGIIEAGPASVRYSITDREGIVALDTGRGADGPGYDYLRRALQELLSGSTSNVGALLGPLGVRFVVAKEGDLPPPAAVRLNAQLDMDLVPAGGLTIYRNARALPVASVVTSPGFSRVARSTGLLAIASSARPQAVKLAATGTGWSGSSEGGFVYVAQQFDSGWRARTSASPTAVGPQRAFGWAMGFPIGTGGSTAGGGPGGAATVTVMHDRDLIGTVELWGLAILWLAALWITRKPGSS
jgi:GT2 family glycosyltransferase